MIGDADAAVGHDGDRNRVAQGHAVDLLFHRAGIGIDQNGRADGLADGLTGGFSLAHTQGAPELAAAGRLALEAAT